MSVTLTTEQETKLQRKATRMGKPMMAVLDELLNDQEPSTPTARQLLNMSKQERATILRAQIENAMRQYEADLLLPVEQRELTAFTALDGDACYDYSTSRTKDA